MITRLIDIINDSIRQIRKQRNIENNSHLICIKTIQPSSVAPAYKTFILRVIFSSDVDYEVFKFTHKEKSISKTDEERIWIRLEDSLIKEMETGLMTTCGWFDNIILGTFKGWNNNDRS